MIRAVAVVALVGAATLLGATAAHADPPPWGNPYTPQDGVCTGAQSDADCWHYTGLSYLTRRTAGASGSR